MSRLTAGIRQEAGRRNETGFSLVDVVFGMAIIGAILLGALATITTAFDGSRDSGDRIRGQLLQSRVLEELQAVPFDALPGTSGTYVEDDGLRADITVVPMESNLLHVEVSVSDQVTGTALSSGVLWIASTN